jgi:hypothetical protein
MVQNYRNKFHLQSYLIARIAGAFGFLCFSLIACWLVDSQFHISEVSWWRFILLTAVGYGLSAFVDRMVPYFEKQREEKERMNAVCTYAPGAISILTLPDLRYYFVNEVGQQMIEQLSGIDNPIGKTFREVHGETKSSGTESALLHIVKTGTFLNKSEIRLKPKGMKQREIVCDMKAFPFRDQYGQIAGVVLYYYDITNQVRARRGAELANNEKTEFTKRAGHEVYEAIVKAKDKIDLLRKNQVAISDRDLLFNSVSKAMDDLAKLSREVTELGRIHAGELPVELSWYSLGSVLNDLMGHYESLAEEKGLRFLAPEDLSDLPTVLGDLHRTVDLLETLFSTAVRLTPKGRVEFRVSVESASEQAIIEIKIIYTGYAQDSIALTYSQKLAQLLGGELTLEQNKSGAGFLFRYRFGAEIPVQATKVFEFKPSEAQALEEISETDDSVLPPIKKTGS